MNLIQKLFRREEPKLSIEAAKAMYALCTNANEHLSSQNYEGMLAAQNDLIELQKSAKASGAKNIKVLANSAVTNITEARKSLENLTKHSTAGSNWSPVQVTFNDYPQLNRYLRALYSDYLAISQELEKYGGSTK